MRARIDDWLDRLDRNERLASLWAKLVLAFAVLVVAACLAAILGTVYLMLAVALAARLCLP
jgi:fatty acid desaturase